MIDITHSEMKCFTYQEWNQYFADNHKQRLKIDFSQEKALSLEQQKLIFPSIQAFQKGEGSDGRYLMKTAKIYIEVSGESEYKDATQWFIKEENYHSSYLKKYMDFYHIKPLKKSFLDYIFRWLRQLGGLKCEVIVLVTAEMIALTYYAALSQCTLSPVLKSICQQMLHDEIAHIIFQSFTLSHFHNGQFTNFLRVVLMKLTLWFVWMNYHKVYQTGGYTYKQYVKENMGCLRQSLKLSQSHK